MEHYPAWLYQSLVADDLPWQLAREFTFQEFAEKYTLHDSYWVGLFYDVAYENSVTLAIVWDAVWLPDTIAKSTAITNEWPLLFIKVRSLARISTSGYQNIGGIQRGIAKAQLTEVERNWLLVISDHYGGNVELLFNSPLKFLALNRNKAILPI